MNIKNGKTLENTGTICSELGTIHESPRLFTAAEGVGSNGW